MPNLLDLRFIRLSCSKKRMRPLTMPMPIPMTMTGVLAVCCLVLGCAADLPAVENSKSVADTGRSRFKRRAVNICQLTKHSVEEISDSTKDSLQEIRDALGAMQISLERYHNFVVVVVCLFAWTIVWLFLFCFCLFVCLLLLFFCFFLCLFKTYRSFNNPTCPQCWWGLVQSSEQGWVCLLSFYCAPISNRNDFVCLVPCFFVFLFVCLLV